MQDDTTSTKRNRGARPSFVPVAQLMDAAKNILNLLNTEGDLIEARQALAQALQETENTVENKSRSLVAKCAAARYETDEIEIDDRPFVVPVGSGHCWVSAWLWVPVDFHEEVEDE